MDKILITDLRATGIIGIKSPERDQPQTLLINLTLYTDLHPAGISDDIKDTVSYSTAAKAVRARVAETQFRRLKPSRRTLPYAARTFPLHAVKIIEKPEFIADTSRVGVEIYREVSSFIS